MRWLLVLAVCATSSVASANTLRCKPCTLPILGARVQVEGTIDDAPFAVHLVGHAQIFRVGAVELHDVSIVARDRGAGIDTCVAGGVAGGRLTACTRLPPSLGGIEEMHAADVRWQLANGPVTGHGTAHLAWDRRGVRLEHGKVALASRARTIGGVALGPATFAAEVNGDLSHLALDLAGELHVASLDVGPLHLHELQLPLAVHENGLVATPRSVWVARVGSATFDFGGRVAQLANPSVIVHDATSFAWPAFLGEPHRLAWTAISGLPIAAGAGELTLQYPRISAAHVAMLGGELRVVPFTLGTPALAVHAEGLAVADVVALASRGRATGTGVLDGNFIFDHGKLGRAVFAARAPGALRLRDPLWPTLLASIEAGPALHRRILLALSDFAYDRWTIDVQQSGIDPDCIMVLHGHGLRLPQELDLTFNVRGLRELEN
ncbi:MAG TPA: YdbH domain-containing protein [Kofleriaceae bacterium]|nr:YdbH domain-containing protein [Kofleriaceae bacterium]